MPLLSPSPPRRPVTVRARVPTQHRTSSAHHGRVLPSVLLRSSASRLSCDRAPSAAPVPKLLSVRCICHPCRDTQVFLLPPSCSVARVLAAFVLPRAAGRRIVRHRRLPLQLYRFVMASTIIYVAMWAPAIRHHSQCRYSAASLSHAFPSVRIAFPAAPLTCALYSCVCSNAVD
jgi:hypothetical protein